MSEAKKRRGAGGGNARAERLSPEQRSAIAKQAAAKRWGNKNLAPEEVNDLPDLIPVSSPTAPPPIPPPPPPTYAPPAPDTAPRPKKRQSKPMPKAFKGASSYAEKRLAEALKERAEYMGRVAALNAEIPSLVSVIRALGGNPNIGSGTMIAYPPMEMTYPVQPMYQHPINPSVISPQVDQMANVPNIDPALFKTNTGPVPGITAPQGPMVPGMSGGGAADLDYVPRDNEEGPGLPKMGGGWM